MLLLFPCLEFIYEWGISDFFVFDDAEDLDEFDWVIEGEEVYVLNVALNDTLLKPLLQLTHIPEVLFDAEQFLLLILVARAALDFIEEWYAHVVHDFDSFINCENLILILQLGWEFLYLLVHVEEILEHPKYLLKAPLLSE